MGMGKSSFLVRVLLFFSAILPIAGYAAVPENANHIAVHNAGDIQLSYEPDNRSPKPKEIPSVDTTSAPVAQPVKTTPVAPLKNTMGGFTFQLSFEPNKLQVGKKATGTLVVTDAQGQPVTTLEPLVGDFVQVVGFESNFKTAVHGHPLDSEEPTSASDRGGPEVHFHLEPVKPGFIRLFVQVVINGKEIFVPFGVTIQPA